MVAFGTVGAAAVSLLAVALALWIATSDRHETREREQRERARQAAQRKIDDAVVILEAWEQCWNLAGRDAIVGALGIRDKPGFDVARARLSALLRASQNDYPLGWSAFERKPDPEFHRAVDQAPEGEEPRGRWVIRREILRLIEEAQRQLGVATLQQPSSLRRYLRDTRRLHPCSDLRDPTRGSRWARDPRGSVVPPRNPLPFAAESSRRSQIFGRAAHALAWLGVGAPGPLGQAWDPRKEDACPSS